MEELLTQIEETRRKLTEIIEALLDYPVDPSCRSLSVHISLSIDPSLEAQAAGTGWSFHRLGDCHYYTSPQLSDDLGYTCVHVRQKEPDGV